MYTEIILNTCAVGHNRVYNQDSNNDTELHFIEAGLHIILDSQTVDNLFETLCYVLGGDKADKLLKHVFIDG